MQNLNEQSGVDLHEHHQFLAYEENFGGGAEINTFDNRQVNVQYLNEPIQNEMQYFASSNENIVVGQAEAIPEDQQYRLVPSRVVKKQRPRTSYMTRGDQANRQRAHDAAALT